MLTPNKNEILPAGIASWHCKAEGDTSYYPLGGLREGSITYITLVQKESRGRHVPYAAELTARAKLLNTERSSMLGILPALATSNISHIVTLVNGQSFSSALGASGTWGVEWKFASDKDHDSIRHIELSARCRMSMAELDLVRGAPPSVGVPDSGDSLHGLNVAPAAARPSGIVRIQLREKSGSVWSDDAGHLREGKFSAELLTVNDARMRPAGFGIRIVVSAELLQTSSAALSRITQLNGQQNDARLTFADGLTATLDDALGLAWEYKNEGDSEETSVIALHGEGIILPSQWGGIWQ